MCSDDAARPKTSGSGENSEMLSADVAIELCNVGKTFEIYDRPVDRLLQMLCRGRRNFYRCFTALRDINLIVRRGESVGIVGRNGAGKSTLLQIIAGTLTPTQGTARALSLIHI